jgi:signal transduction histidine kinase
VGFEAHGNTNRIPVHAWSVLEPCLKEALTNGARHLGSDGIDVSLDVGPSIVRLSVHNGGRAVPRVGGGGGIGLRNLRQRAQAVGGSVNVDTAAGFRLVCVLPLDEPGLPSP